MLTFGSLFAGIGGFDLGFERAGMQCKWQVEIDPYCQKVLAKHWPDVRRHDDVRTWPQRNTQRVDVICGGFPCQDISNAGLRAGITGERSGLWKEYLRIICDLRPRFVAVENVAALLIRGMDVVLGDLADCGYDAEWDCISAAAVGAPHIRKRMFILAYPKHGRIQERRRAANASSQTCGKSSGLRRDDAQSDKQKAVAVLADTDSNRLSRWDDQGGAGSETETIFSRSELSRAYATNQRGQWAVEPPVGRVANGIPNRVQRLKGLGNAVVPQIAEYIGHLIIQASEATNAE
jgi:DNA (cytosine-5)-methyltransferase 1